MEPLPDLTSLSDDDLKKLIDDLTEEEQEISYRRRLLHGKIDILRAELVGAPAEVGGEERPRAGRRRGSRADPGRQGVAAERGARLSHLYCPECGFQNPESSNYCAKCGALLVRDEGGSDTTMSYTPEEADEDAGAILDEIKTEGPALVVRSGGGRAGEHFLLGKEQTTVGRSPDCDVFLDDVTVSRRHALVLHRNGQFIIEDKGSLNGTFLNRRRIESGELEDGDEVQIGKYRLTFLSQ